MRLTALFGPLGFGYRDVRDGDRRRWWHLRRPFAWPTWRRTIEWRDGALP